METLAELQTNQIMREQCWRLKITLCNAKGRSAIKQYIPLKPTKRGYKLWIRADSKTGYVCKYKFEVYSGN